MQIGLLIFDAVDLLDVGGPYEVFLTANRLAERAGDPAPFRVAVTSIDGGAQTAYGGVGLFPTATDPMAELDAPDLLVVPGLIDVDAAVADSRLIAAIKAAAGRAGTVAAVCTGAFLLAAAGLLAGVPATTHHADVAKLATVIGPDAAQHRRWVDAGRVVTSGGLSSGIAMALHLVRRFVSLDLAQRTARHLEYAWDPNAGLVVDPTPAPAS